MIKRISIFFEHFEPIHEFKEIGQIALGLIDIGVSADVITLDKDCLSNYHSGFKLVRGASENFVKDDFWKNTQSEFIIFLFGLQYYRKHFQAIKAANKKIIIKLDSNGQLWYPLHYFRSQNFKHSASWLRRLARIIKWSIPFWRSGTVRADLRQLEIADAITIESPEALANLVYLLNYWRRPDLIAKSYFVPSPVTPIFSDETLLPSKENIIISIGRWDDLRQKNTKLMIKTLAVFLRREKNYTAKIIGSGKDIVEKLLSRYANDISDRIEVTGPLSHDKLKNHLMAAKIFFMPSRWESFGLAAAEAICCGCSIVGTPLEPLKYLSMQGFSGVTAVNFSKRAVLAALLLSAEKWERKEYDPEEIANFWRKKLNRETIAKEFIKIAEKI